MNSRRLIGLPSRSVLSLTLPEMVPYLSAHVVASAYPAGGVHRAVPPPLSKLPRSGTAGCTKSKHDGFRVIARKQDKRVRFYSRPGNDLTKRFPRITARRADLANHQPWQRVA